MRKLFFWASSVSICAFLLVYDLVPINSFGLLNLKILTFISGMLSGCLWGMMFSVWVLKEKKEKNDE